MLVFEVSGQALVDPVTATANAHHTSSTSASVDLPDTTDAETLTIGVCRGPEALTVGGVGWTEYSAGVAAGLMQYSLVYQQAAVTGSYDPAWSWTTAGANAAVAICIKAAAGPAPGPSTVLQCRVGIARVGATRTGYFSQVVRVTIGGAPADIRAEDFSIVDRGRTRSAFFGMLTPPTIGSVVEISIGSADNRLFAGHIVDVEATLVAAGLSTIVYDVTAESFAWALNLVKPIGYWAGTTYQILTALLEEWAPDFTRRLQAGLGSIGAELLLTGEEGLADVLDRLTASLTGGRWLVTDEREIVVYTVGNLPLAQPDVLDDDNPQLLGELAVRQTLTRTANYVLVKGASTRLLADVSALETCLPVESVEPFSQTGGAVLLGAAIQMYSERRAGGSSCASKASDTGDTAPGSATLPVQNLALFSGTGGWAQTGQRVYVRYTGRSAASGAGTLTGIPASGPGSLSAPVKWNEQISAVPCLAGVASDPYYLPKAWPSAYPRAATAGDAVTALGLDLNGVDRAALAGVLGLSNGLAQAVVTDPTLASSEARALAQSLALALSRPTGLWELAGASRDPQIWAGRTLVVALTSPAVVSRTFYIDEVVIRDLARVHGKTLHPIREFRASEFRPGDPLGYIFLTDGRVR